MWFECAGVACQVTGEGGSVQPQVGCFWKTTELSRFGTRGEKAEGRGSGNKPHVLSAISVPVSKAVHRTITLSHVL